MKLKFILPAGFFLAFLSFNIASCQTGKTNTDQDLSDSTASVSQDKKQSVAPKPIDTAQYQKLLMQMANNDTTGLWPVKSPIPLPGAIFPFNRVVAYYGNLYSKKMGVLGEYPKDEMLKKLIEECKNWQAADSTIPVIPALHYVAVTAQGAPGKDNKHRLRMPFHQIDTIINWANEIDGLVFLDIQVGHSTVQAEVPALEQYLLKPKVHLGIDPEFSMTGGHVPGKKIGTFDATDINFAIDYLANLVKKNNLPPKILVVHRFTQGMVTNYKNIKIVPEVQVVMDMDGWGPKFLKRSTYLRYIYKEPVEFTGFKIFYKNDTKTGQDQLYKPEDLMKFVPKPIYIQYQ